MRKIEERYLAAVYEVTGVQGRDLDMLTGGALAVAKMGKLPVRNDLVFFLGLTDGNIDGLTKSAVENAWEHGLGKWLENYYSKEELPAPKQVFYMLAARLIAEGVYCLHLTTNADGAFVEDANYKKVRLFLNNQFTTKSIQSRAQYDGYIKTLEYLYAIAQGNEIELSRFVQIRYSGVSHISSNLAQFCAILYDKPYKHFVEMFTDFKTAIAKT